MFRPPFFHSFPALRVPFPQSSDQLKDAELLTLPPPSIFFLFLVFAVSLHGMEPPLHYRPLLKSFPSLLPPPRFGDIPNPFPLIHTPSSLSLLDYGNCIRSGFSSVICWGPSLVFPCFLSEPPFAVFFRCTPSFMFAKPSTSFCFS